MKTIHKYPIAVTDRVTIDMPQGAKVLSVQLQHERVQVWALGDPAQPYVARRFRVYGTGHAVDEEGTFIGTVQVTGLVFHVFEVTT